MSGCEIVSGHPLCACVEFMDSGWKKLSCGLALEKTEKWLQLRCFIREIKNKHTMKCLWDRPYSNHVSSGWVGKWLSEMLLMGYPGHPTSLSECVDVCLWGKTQLLRLKTVPSVHMHLKCLDGGWCRTQTQESDPLGHLFGNKDPQVSKQRVRERKAAQGKSMTVCHKDLLPTGWDLQELVYGNVCAWQSIYEKWCWAKEKPTRERTGIWITLNTKKGTSSLK